MYFIEIVINFFPCRYQNMKLNIKMNFWTDQYLTSVEILNESNAAFRDFYQLMRHVQIEIGDSRNVRGFISCDVRFIHGSLIGLRFVTTNRQKATFWLFSWSSLTNFVFAPSVMRLKRQNLESELQTQTLPTVSLPLMLSFIITFYNSTQERLYQAKSVKYSFR